MIYLVELRFISFGIGDASFPFSLSLRASIWGNNSQTTDPILQLPDDRSRSEGNRLPDWGLPWSGRLTAKKFLVQIPVWTGSLPVEFACSPSEWVFPTDALASSISRKTQIGVGFIGDFKFIGFYSVALWLDGDLSRVSPAPRPQCQLGLAPAPIRPLKNKQYRGRMEGLTLNCKYKIWEIATYISKKTFWHLTDGSLMQKFKNFEENGLN